MDDNGRIFARIMARRTSQTGLSRKGETRQLPEWPGSTKLCRKQPEKECRVTMVGAGRGALKIYRVTYRAFDIDEVSGP